jgi:hypothetical protein
VVQELPPSTQETSTAPPSQRGSTGGPGEPTINVRNVDGGPLGGGAGGPGAPTINAKNIDGRPLGRQS